MGCSSSYTTADEVAEFICRMESFNPHDEPTVIDVNRYITKVARQINVTLRATAQCDCTFSTDALEYLQQLNIIGASLMIVCHRCQPQFTDDERRYWGEWLKDELSYLRSGELDLCDGATAKQYPAMTWAEQSLTDFNIARIVYNDVLRNS